MRAIFSRCLAIALLSAASAWAQPAATAPEAPADAHSSAQAAAPNLPLPSMDDTNAQRAKTQPGNNAPFWREVRNSGEVAGISNIRGAESGVLIQRFEQYPGTGYTTAGEAWRQVRNRFIIPYGGSLLLIVVVAIGIFYFTRGPIGHSHAQEGRRIERFTPLERSAHWLNAIAFVLLAVSGLVMAFGKFVLLPWMGHSIFGGLTYFFKTVHNFVGPLFAVSLLVILITFLKDNLPRAWDWLWIKKAGGLFSGQEVPSHRFNAGEKIVYWMGALALGLTVVVSGLFLDALFPNVLYTRGQMQVAHMVHAIAAVLMMCVFLGHIYLGTIGMRGAYRAMRNGHVTESWAKEHHSLWYDDIKAGKIPAQRSTSAAQATAPSHATVQPREI